MKGRVKESSALHVVQAEGPALGDLEWLLLDSKTTVAEDGKTFLLMADLNLDFESSVDKRRAAFEEYVTSINAEKRLTAKVNFPFLDGGFCNGATRTAIGVGDFR